MGSVPGSGAAVWLSVWVGCCRLTERLGRVLPFG